ncbi:hypothetical protein Tco_0769929 [Tanacetum coccineum]|uniref:Uncharacterized protein n=1 Tax=Tanacetum coccineum TaxID=301880 RepID=A0ABQ4ZEN2_9ASTR
MSILLAEKLTSSNFTNWYRNLRIVLRYEKKIKFVEQLTGPAPDPETADPDTIDKYYGIVNLEQKFACLMLSIKAIHACKQEEGKSVSSYLLKMKSYLDTLEHLGYVMLNKLGVGLILNSLNKDFDQFIHNYNMHIMGKTIAELHAILKIHEKGIPKKAETPAGLRESRKLKHGALSLYMGNGMRAAVEAIGSFDLIIPRYPKETMGYYFYYSLENKIFVAQNAEFFENSLMVQEASRSHGLLESSGSDRGLELIQEEDTQPSKNTSEIHDEVAPIEVEPQNVEVPIRRSLRIHQAPDRYGFYVDVEEYELGDLNEPPNYKAALSNLEFDKWLEAMNT